MSLTREMLNADEAEMETCIFCLYLLRSFFRFAVSHRNNSKRVVGVAAVICRVWTACFSEETTVRTGGNDGTTCRQNANDVR